MTNQIEDTKVTAWNARNAAYAAADAEYDNDLTIAGKDRTAIRLATQKYEAALAAARAAFNDVIFPGVF